MHVINKQYNTNINITDHKKSPRMFYKHVLFPYREAIGVWQRHNLKYYSSILRVVVKSDELCFEELIPPPKLAGDFKVLDFLKICYDSSSGQQKIENKSQLAKSSTVRVLASEDAGLSIILPDAIDLTVNPDSWRDVMADYVRMIGGEDATMTDLLLLRFIETLHSRGLHRYFKLEEPRANFNKFPLTEGIFLGDYGAHGIEVVQLQIRQPPTTVAGTQGVKVTGDPNITFGEITFRITDDRCLDMTLDDQISMANVEKFQEDPKYTELVDDLEMDFVIPQDCFERETVPFKKCRGRWSAEGQIAQHGGYNPSFIPAQFILFNHQYFGVIFLELSSIVLYRRVTDDIFIK